VNDAHSIPGYTPTADDQENPNSLIGSFETGSSFFHVVVECNITYDNVLMQRGTPSNPTKPTATASSSIPMRALPAILPITPAPFTVPA
jgi:hypothetical protein